MKKLLFLGGSDIQVPGIKFIKSLGYYVITCDYLPNNPGHKFSDKYYNISSTDLDGILEIAKKESVDGITSYASDPAALTASYVSEKLGLIGVPFDSAKILSNKDEFRQFLLDNNIIHPPFTNVTSRVEIEKFIEKHGKSIIKPVDSSGSKGITIIDTDSDLETILKESKKYARNGRVIVEKFINRKGKQICGDVVVLEGQLFFSGYGNVHFDDDCDSVTPCSITLPANNEKRSIITLNETLQQIFTELKITSGTFNVDSIVDEGGNVYIVEIGARNGGNLFTELIKMQSGFDIVRVTLEGSMKELKINDVVNSKKFNKDSEKDYYAHYVLHSKESGVLEGITFSDDIKNNVVYKNIRVKKGEIIKNFNGSNDRLGLCLLSFDSYDEMVDKVKNFDYYVKIKVKKL